MNVRDKGLMGVAVAMILVLVVSIGAGALAPGHEMYPELPQALVSGNVWCPRPLRMAADGSNFYGLSRPDRAVISQGETLAFGDFVGAHYSEYDFSADQMRQLYLSAGYYLENADTGERVALGRFLSEDMAYLILPYPVGFLPQPGSYKVVVENAGRSRAWPVTIVE